MGTSDAERSGRPVEVTTPEIIDKIHDMGMDDRIVKMTVSSFLGEEIELLIALDEDYVESEYFLKNRFAQALAIKGTQQYHAFIPRSKSKILVKNFSMNSEACEMEVSKFPDKLKLADISGYISVVYKETGGLDIFLEKNEELDEVKVTFLHPAGPSKSSRIQEMPIFLGSQ
uniref:Uncharacterized protein n=1 Tax=Rhodnius prolixus TaxID=13249 RepID=T1HXW8_RHOPR